MTLALHALARRGINCAPILWVGAAIVKGMMG
jgi:hypothetical protein